jgi:hypothetical protein
MAPDSTTRGTPVMLSNWLQELRATTNVDEVVTFAAAHLERIKASGQLPRPVAQHAVDGPDDIRDITAELAHQPFTYNAPGYESGLDQQLLILFSLATDRLAQLEGRGSGRRPSSPNARAQ